MAPHELSSMPAGREVPPSFCHPALPQTHSSRQAARDPQTDDTAGISHHTLNIGREQKMFAFLWKFLKTEAVSSKKQQLPMMTNTLRRLGLQQQSL